MKVNEHAELDKRGTEACGARRPGAPVAAALPAASGGCPAGGCQNTPCAPRILMPITSKTTPPVKAA